MHIEFINRLGYKRKICLDPTNNNTDTLTSWVDYLNRHSRKILSVSGDNGVTIMINAQE